MIFILGDLRGLLWFVRGLLPYYIFIIIKFTLFIFTLNSGIVFIFGVSFLGLVKDLGDSKGEKEKENPLFFNFLHFSRVKRGAVFVLSLGEGLIYRPRSFAYYTPR